MLAGHFAEPRGDNALGLYRQVLQRDSENREASEGLAKIANHYELAARKYSAEENWTQSLAQIERGLRAQPQHPGLLALRKQVYAEIEALKQPRKPDTKKLRTFGTF
jgi:small-conductance mechanosensitive channel